MDVFNPNRPSLTAAAILMKCLLLVLYCLVASGCGSGGGSSAPRLVAITISTQIPPLMVGQSIQLNATGIYNNNETHDITHEVTWMSSDEAIAIVENEGDRQGLLTALTAGEATVTVVLNNIESSQGIIIHIATWTQGVFGLEKAEAECIRQTSDNGFILTGRTKQAGGDWDIYLVKLDAFGAVVWENTYGGSEDDTGKSVVEADGTYIVAGQIALDTTSDIYLLCTDQTGTILWEKTFGGLNDDVANSIQTTTDGNLIIAGSTVTAAEVTNDVSNKKNWDLYLLKTDFNGTLIWETTMTTIDDGLPESEVSYEIARSVRQVSDGGFIIAGSVENVSTFGDFLLILTDEAGNPRWQQTFGESWSYEHGFDVVETPFGGFIVVGSINHVMGPGEYGCLAIQTDADGNQEWRRNYYTLAFDTRYAITPAADGNGYGIAGVAYSYSTNSLDISLFKIDANGDIIWERLYGDQTEDIGVSLQQTSDGGYIVAGNSTSEETESILILKTYGDGDIDGLTANPY